MSRLLLIALLVLALPLSTFAGEKETASCAGLTVDSLARLMLEGDGPEQALVAQALRQADRVTLVALQRALREVAPEIEKEKKRRGPEPDLEPKGDNPIHLVNIEVRFLDLEPNFLKDVGHLGAGKGHVSGLSAHELGAKSITYMDDLECEVILRAVEKSERITQVTAPRLTVYDRQRANVSVLNQKSFVGDAKVVDTGNGVTVIDPVVELAQEGVVLNVRPTLSEDRRYITLELGLLHATLVDAPKKAVVHAGKTVPLTMPDTQLNWMRSTVRLPDEGTVFVDPGMRVGKRVRVAMITARHVELTAAELRDAAPMPPEGERKQGDK